MSQASNGLILDNYHLLSTLMSGTVPKSFHILYNKEGVISSLCNLNSEWFTLKVTQDVTELRFRSRSVHLQVSLVANYRISRYSAAFMLPPGRHFGISQTMTLVVCCCLSPRRP